MLAASPWGLPVGVAVAVVAGAWAIGRTANGGDPGWVVIDEVAGQWLAMLPLVGMPRSWRLLAGTALAFALFRLFDIAKPGPIGWVDRHTGAWAVMGDDLVAGAFAACGVAAAAELVLGYG